MHSIHTMWMKHPINPIDGAIDAARKSFMTTTHFSVKTSAANMNECHRHTNTRVTLNF